MNDGDNLPLRQLRAYLNSGKCAKSPHILNWMCPVISDMDYLGIIRR